MSKRFWVKAFLLLVLVAGGAAAAKRLGVLARLKRAGVRAAVASAPLEPFRRPPQFVVDDVVYDKGLRPGWQDWGWAPREVKSGQPARINFSGWAGWQLARPGLRGDFAAFSFRYRAPTSFGRFLQVFLGNGSDARFRKLNVDAQYERKLSDGFTEVYLPLQHLNPTGAKFEQVTIFVAKDVPSQWVVLDKIGFVSTPDPTTLPPSTREVVLQVECDKPGRDISPLIYGVALDWMGESKSQHHWSLGATARRWGGNPTSRYNWRLGNAWNTAMDWYFENVDYIGVPGYSYRRFLDDNAQRGTASALTLPMIGWVAKDITSVGFPRSAEPTQDGFDGFRPEAGNGMKAGRPLPSGPPTRTSVPASPEFIAEWVRTIRQADKASNRRSVHQYILDNEPALWSSTHRDVHPHAVTYDELLERTIAYATAIRRADPEGTIAGPAEWGWTNYFFSARDFEPGALQRADRLKHGNRPLVEWYLQRLREHADKTHTRLLDVLDLHFYPQQEGVYSPEATPALAALRIRSTRALWDPSYKDESWIDEPVRLLPRMREWVNANYPGLGISIGEWNFGGETHMSGGLAVAEALGRFAEYGVNSAFYWTAPPADSPAFHAFRAYRNYDGNGARFGEVWVPTRMAGDVSLFASRDRSRRRYVLVALNSRPDSIARARIELRAASAPEAVRAFSFTPRTTGIVPVTPPKPAQTLAVELPPYSITVLELKMKG
jgi:hypothetical protein